jgi:3-phytase
MPKPVLAPALLVLLLAACATSPSAVPTVAPLEPGAAPVHGRTIAEAYVSADVPGEELDSLATWTGDDGSTWLIATAKSAHRLVVFDADSGALLRTFGTKGSAPGRFNRPNGIAMFGDLLFVVERDNRRVQVLRLPGFATVGTFGQDELRSPYGLWLHETAPGELEVYVTDSYMEGERFDVVPALSELGERVRRYRVVLDEDDGIQAQQLTAFGSTQLPGALRMVESIAGDPLRQRLLIADEFRPGPSNLRVYDFNGRYSSRSLPDGTFLGEAEGVALWTCDGNAGYWVAVDQQAPLTNFHLFDRNSLDPSGSFHGRVTSQTDGIALHAAATPRFPAGALFAVHDDRAVVAFDLREVVDALGLDPACLP